MGKASLKIPYHIEYGGFKDSVWGVHVSKRPSIPAPREIIQTYQIPGRDGALTIKDGTYEDVRIPVEFSFSAYPDTWQEVVAGLKIWLLERGSGAELRMTDLPDYFYKVRYVEMSEVEREYRKVGTFTAEFVCEGCQYYDSGKTEQVVLGSLTNPGIISHPKYLIAGTGSCTLTVNGKSLQATVSSNMTIDTDKAMAYRTSSVMQNTALIMGDYGFADFWLQPGNNSISISSGFTLRIIPNWRRL